MKKNIYNNMKRLVLFVFVALTLTSCEKFLDTTNYLSKDDSNFPQTAADLQALLTSVYADMQIQISSINDGNFLSDDQFCGGGPTDYLALATDGLTKSDDNMYLGDWTTCYQGIYNANKVIEGCDKVDFSSDTTDKNTILGEAYFMRAYMYKELALLFGGVPLYTSSNVDNVERSSAPDVFALIASDLKNAIELLPNVSFTNESDATLGHATKWAAEAMLARMFLFYTGYYNAIDMPLYGDDTNTLTKQQVIGYVEDCINNSGHKLLPDFRSLWFYSNTATGADYPYNVETGVTWIGDTKANTEAVFDIKYNTRGGWNNAAYGNGICLNYALRGQDDYSLVFPFGMGWGQGTVNSRLVEAWNNDAPGDIRIKASVLNVLDSSEGIKSYQEGGWDQQYETHLWCKKYTGVMAWQDAAKTQIWGAADALYGVVIASGYFWNPEDFMVIRFSEVLLDHSELTQTVTGINQVRARVGLPPIASYSLEALQKERRYELAFEGLRYWDLLRWYGKQAGTIIDANQNGVNILQATVPSTVKFNLTQRVNDTGGLLQIPQSQIDLSNGKLTQNPGW